jgi:hypothetical protein
MLGVEEELETIPPALAVLVVAGQGAVQLELLVQLILAAAVVVRATVLLAALPGVLELLQFAIQTHTPLQPAQQAPPLLQRLVDTVFTSGQATAQSRFNHGTLCKT